MSFFSHIFVFVNLVYAFLNYSCICSCCKYSDPYGHDVPVNLLQFGTRHVIEFTPQEVGSHTIDIKCAGQSIVGSPYTANVYDITKVHILDQETNGVVGNETSITGQFNGHTFSFIDPRFY